MLSTVIFISFFSPFSFITVITVVPAFIGVTTPVFETIATSSLLDSNFTLFEFTSICTFSPTFILSVFIFTSKVGSVLVVVVTDVFTDGADVAACTVTYTVSD